MVGLVDGMWGAEGGVWCGGPGGWHVGRRGWHVVGLVDGMWGTEGGVWCGGPGGWHAVTDLRPLPLEEWDAWLGGVPHACLSVRPVCFVDVNRRSG